MSIIQRIKEMAEQEGLTLTQLEREIGASAGTLTRALKHSTDIQTKWIMAILERYDWPAEWILRGREGGELEISSPLRPHIPLLAAAGPLLGDAPSIGPADCEWLPVVPGFPAYDLTISVSGDSMAPGVMAGDRLYCRRLADKALIAWGQPYLVSTADGAAVKRLYDEGDALRCESDNPRYPPYLLPKRLVLAVYRVVALARF